MLNFKANINISSEILNLISEIDEFKGKWDLYKNLVPERLEILKKISTIESIGSSTRIEGAKLSNLEVEDLFGNINKQNFKSRDEEEVAGYAITMETVFDSYVDIKITENYIKQLHSMLLKYSTKDANHKGEYKKLSNSVEAFDQDGKSLGVVFQTVSPFDTPIEMERLIFWLKISFEEDLLHPLLVIGIFIVSFLAIHPFQDGNGRLSRILTSLLLLKKGYAYIPFSSLERVIEESKDFYYLSLRRTQITLQDEAPDFESWLVFFLKSLKKQKDILLDKLEKDKFLMASISGLSAQIVEIIKEKGKTNISDIEDITKANRNTVKATLRKLVDDKYIVKHGKGRGVWYSLFK